MAQLCPLTNSCSSSRCSHRCHRNRTKCRHYVPNSSRQTQVTLTVRLCAPQWGRPLRAEAGWDPRCVVPAPSAGPGARKGPCSCGSRPCHLPSTTCQTAQPLRPHTRSSSPEPSPLLPWPHRPPSPSPVPRSTASLGHSQHSTGGRGDMLCLQSTHYVSWLVLASFHSLAHSIPSRS